jgi:hypothetical protein
MQIKEEKVIVDGSIYTGSAKIFRSIKQSIDYLFGNTDIAGLLSSQQYIFLGYHRKIYSIKYLLPLKKQYQPVNQNNK